MRWEFNLDQSERLTTLLLRGRPKPAPQEVTNFLRSAESIVDCWLQSGNRASSDDLKNVVYGAHRLASILERANHASRYAIALNFGAFIDRGQGFSPSDVDREAEKITEFLERLKIAAAACELELTKGRRKERQRELLVELARAHARIIGRAPSSSREGVFCKFAAEICTNLLPDDHAYEFGPQLLNDAIDAAQEDLQSQR